MFKYLIVLLCLLFGGVAEAKTIDIGPCGECLEFDITDTNEYWENLTGGVRHYGSYIGQTIVSSTINFNNIFSRDDIGDVYISAVNNRGNPMSNTNLKTFDFISNIENYNQSKLYEFYYENKIGNIFFKIGKFDFSSDFGFDNLSAKFLNASMMTSMVINNNTYNMTNYGPTASPGIEVRYYHDNWILKLGLSSDNPYNGNLNLNFANINTDKFGTDLFFKKPMFYLEYVYNLYIKNLKGTYYIGGFYDTGKQANTYSNHFYSGNGAGYFTLNQEIFKNKTSNLSIFLRYMIDPYNSRTNITSTFDTGLVYNTRDDYFGLSFSIAHANKHITTTFKDHNEYRIEFTYKHQINKYLFIQPDIQYIIHPSSGIGIKNEFVMGLRTVFNY